MNKKVGIIVGILAVVGIAGGFIGWWISRDEPVNNNEVINEQETNIQNNQTEDEKYVGAPIPNIINRAGTIKKIKRDTVIINGPDDEDVYIYVNDDTKIYGPDGSEKSISDLKAGVYITVDIDGDNIDESYEADEFDAMIIYISGK